MSLRGQSKIPVPSFGIPPFGNKPGTTQQQQNQQQEQPQDEILIQLPVNDQVMIRLEIALQLHRHQQQNPKSDRISFSEFCKIASKVDTTMSSSTDISALLDENEDKVVDDGGGGDYDSKNPTKLQNTLTEDSLGLWKLSKEERFWHDVYCVAIPELYRAGDGNNNDNSNDSGEDTATDHMEQQQNSGSSSSSSSSNVNIHPNKERRIAAAARLALTTTTTTGMPAASVGTQGNHNRLKELRRLVREARTRGISKARSDRAFRLLLTLRQETTRHAHNKTKAVAAAGDAAIAVGDCSTCSSNGNNSGNQNNKHDKLGTADFLLRDPVSSTASTANHNHTNNNGIGKSDRENSKRNFGGSKTTTTTIDDRIRARARERENNLQQARAARKDPREERVAIADALYSYACHILRRKRKRSQLQPQSQPRTNQGTKQLLGRGEQRGSSSSRFLDRTATTNNVTSTAATNATTTATIAPSKCIVTFKEVVKNGLANRSRKEITRLFSDIVQVLSESSSVTSVFLKWRDPKTGETNTVPIAKNATVWIDTTNFKRLREILNREQLSQIAVANSKDGKKWATSNGDNDGDNETKLKKKTRKS